MKFDWITTIPFFLACSLFTSKRILRYLRYFQQEEYDSSRFLKWVWSHSAFDKKGTLTILSASLLIFIGLPSWIVILLAAITLTIIAFNEENPLRDGKLKLKLTKRAKEIFYLSFFLYLIFVPLFLWSLRSQTAYLILSQILLFQLTPLYLTCACLLLSSKEKKHQKKLLSEAKQILNDVSPYVVGITGSYGKTSTKDILSQILQVTLGPTFWPAKGINTPMGITREIRSQLRQGFQYAVIEMAAYGPGSIKRLCELTPPHAGVITGIGSAHLERFGNEEIIRRSKAELAQAVPKTGILVCNGDNEGARLIAEENPKQTTLFYGFDKEKGQIDCWISDWKTISDGTTFALHWQGKQYEASTPLFGRNALLNIAAAFTLSCALGANAEYVLAVVHNLEPVENRLQVQKKGPITYLHDAYNSNPLGFSAALQVLKELPGKRRIIMTPGMIELGCQQKPQNEQMGKMASQVCDLALIVGDTNREALTQGLLLGGMSKNNMIFCQTRKIAFSQLEKLLQQDDLVLIENDLPDLYETVMKL